MSLIHKPEPKEPASSAALSTTKTEMLTLICHISHTELLQLCRTNKLDADTDCHDTWLADRYLAQ